jgi:hypothetical protein
MQQLGLGNPDLGETNFVEKRTKKARPQGDNNNRWDIFSMNLEVKPLNTKNQEKLQYRK